MSGTMKTMAALAVLLLAGLGLLLVLDLIPREQFETMAVKGVLAVGILAAASFVVGLLMKSGGTEK